MLITCGMLPGSDFYRSFLQGESIRSTLEYLRNQEAMTFIMGTPFLLKGISIHFLQGNVTVR